MTHGIEPTIYLAAGVRTYATPRYDDALAMVRTQWPHAHVLSPRELYTSTADWLLQWPTVAPRVDALVILPYEDGTTGLGVYTEAQAVRRQGGVVCVIDQGCLHPLARLNRLNAGRLHALTAQQRLRYAHVAIHVPKAPSRPHAPRRADEARVATLPTCAASVPTEHRFPAARTNPPGSPAATSLPERPSDCGRLGPGRVCKCSTG